MRSHRSPASVATPVAPARDLPSSPDASVPEAVPASISERRLEILTQHSTDVLCELRDGVITYVSPNTTRVSGKSPEDFIGQRLGELVHPDDAAALAPFYADGWTGAIEAEFRIMDGARAWQWREARGVRVMDGPGHYRSVLVLRDIAERRRAEAALRESERRSSALLAAIPDLMFRVSRDGECLDFKAEPGAELHVPVEQIVGGNIRDLLPPDVSALAMAAMRRALDDGGVHAIEYSLDKRSGRRDYESRVAACGENEVLIICRDITDRNLLDAALRESEARLRLLYASSPVGIFQTDVDGNCLYTNKRWQEIARVRADEALGAGWAAAIHPDDSEAVFAQWAASVTRGDDFAMEFRFTPREGEPVWVSSLASPLRSDADVVIGYVGTVTDISERKRMEGATREAEERAAILRERSRIAQDLHDPVAQFFFGIGMAATDLLERKQPAPSTFRRKIAKIRRLATDGGREVRSTVYALSSTGLELGLDASIERLAAELRQTNGIVVEYARDEPGKRLNADAQREVCRAAQEALYNVRKHAVASRVVLRLSTGDTGIVLDVCDDGRGVAEEIEQASARGQGFGLRNLRDGFELRGGSVAVRNNVGCPGVTISFRLPMEADA